MRNSRFYSTEDIRLAIGTYGSSW